MAKDNEIVTLPKDVAEAIENLRQSRNSRMWSIDTIRSNAQHSPKSDYGIIDDWILRQYEDKDGIKMYFSALVNGYHVERTPEERLAEYYASQERGARIHIGRKQGVKATLDILGITIDGINDINGNQAEGDE